MNAPNHIRRPISRAARIRVFHAYALMAVLERLSPRTRRQTRRRIAGAAVTAMMVLKRGLEITSHPFEAAGYPLVLSARWNEARATLAIEVDLRQKGVPAVTLIGAPIARWNRRE
jgi:hypothetical protein